MRVDLLGILRQNFYDCYCDMVRIFKDYSTLTIKDAFTFIAISSAISVLPFIYLYVKYEQNFFVYQSIFAIVLDLIIILVSYNSDKYIKIMIAWFYFYFFLITLIFVGYYGWESGSGMFIFVLILLNYFVAIENSSLSNSLATFIITFFSIFFYIKLNFYPSDFSDEMDLFLRWHFILNFLVVTVSSFMVSFFYKVLLKNAILKKKKEKDDIKLSAKMDFLTGLLNRRAIEEELSAKILSSSDIKSVFIIIGDIDNFKSINDTYGHIFGDTVIKVVGQKLLSSFRNNDLVCRWGGEEFFIFCKNINLQTAKAITERARKNIHEQKIKFESKIINVSITFGAVFCNDLTNYDINTLIKKADELLLYGKSNGKNQANFAEVAF